MKNRKREICTSGTVRDEAGNILIYSANDRGDRGDGGIIRSPVRASILPDHLPALAIDVRVKMPRRALERGDDVADVDLLAHAGRPCDRLQRALELQLPAWYMKLA